MRTRSPVLSSRTPSQATTVNTTSTTPTNGSLTALQRLKQRQTMQGGNGGPFYHQHQGGGGGVVAGGLQEDGYCPATTHIATSALGSGPDGFAAAASVAVNQERRLAGLVDMCAQLERQVAQEVSVRVKGTKAVADMMERRIEEAVRELEVKYQDRVVKMHVSVDTLTNKLATLEEQLAVEREKNARLTEELMAQHREQQGGGGGGPLQELRSHMEHQRVMGQDALDKLVQRVTAELGRLDERLDAEHFAREGQVREVQDSLVSAVKKRESNDHLILEEIQQEVAKLAQAVDEERREREVTEENLAVTLEQLVSQIEGSSGRNAA